MEMRATETNWWLDVLKSTGSTPTPRRHNGAHDPQREDIYARALARADLAALRGRRPEPQIRYH